MKQCKKCNQNNCELRFTVENGYKKYFIHCNSCGYNSTESYNPKQAKINWAMGK